ncbi:MAG: enoyl-CoA hydratase/isomerase family protein [Actinobacteria bacterium]|nr:enoyl-CoA hydratase/isomerase family protein [Actinomycetota bacterium]
MRASSRVVVLIAGGIKPPDGIVSAADVVIASPDASPAGAVEAPDPVAAARRLGGQIAGSARASTALAWLLRENEHLPVPTAISAESSVYSTLLAGPDFGRWLAARGAPRPPGPDQRVRVTRNDDELCITLARPGRRNAVDAAMRDALCGALELALWDPALRVTLDAEGPSFCAGGDLDEFGSAPDPATAHLIRVVASAGRMLHELRDRVTVRVHGDCIGAGLELPAFAGRVVAAPGARFRLPEIAMGLVPGAGGTVSLPRRIGRTRTAWLALTGQAIDAETALRWGLVDSIE